MFSAPKALVRSLVGELRSHMLSISAKHNTNSLKIKTMALFPLKRWISGFQESWRQDRIGQGGTPTHPNSEMWACQACSPQVNHQEASTNGAKWNNYSLKLSSKKKKVPGSLKGLRPRMLTPEALGGGKRRDGSFETKVENGSLEITVLWNNSSHINMVT